MPTLLTTVYAVAKSFVPVFNTKETPFKLPFERKKEDGRMMAMETVAFPGTLFTVKNKSGLIWEVETTEYPSSIPIYVDSRLLNVVENPKERIKALPSSEAIFKKFESLVGTRYFWGGNCPEGILELLNLYDNPAKINKHDLKDAVCEGVDCSGLLYYATQGHTPRNTSQLITYGTGVNIDNLSIEQIYEKTKPLDLIVWKGHILIAFPGKKIIESVIGRGVVISPFVQRLEEMLPKLKAENKPYYVRRWHPDMLV